MISGGNIISHFILIVVGSKDWFVSQNAVAYLIQQQFDAFLCLQFLHFHDGVAIIAASFQPRRHSFQLPTLSKSSQTVPKQQLRQIVAPQDPQNARLISNIPSNQQSLSHLLRIPLTTSPTPAFLHLFIAFDTGQIFIFVIDVQNDHVSDKYPSIIDSRYAVQAQTLCISH